MPTQPIPFVNALQSSDEELAGASPQALNVTVDGAGAVRRRPGIGRYFDDATSEVGGLTQAPAALHVTEGGMGLAVVQSTPYKHTFYRVAPGGALSLGSQVGTQRPIVVETEMLVAIATGNQIAKIMLASPTAVTLLGGSPPHASHIVHNSLRLITNDLIVDRTKIRYSDEAAGTAYAGHEMWTVGVGTAGYFTAEASPDPVVAVGENTNELWAFGSRTLQIFAPDEIRVFAPSVTLEVGCAAPYSVVKKEGEFYWLDHARRFVRSNGRGSEVLSKSLHRVVQGLSRVDDCYGYRVLLGSLDAIVWKFPEAGRTFVIQDGAGWAEWTKWDGDEGHHAPLAITSHTYDRATGQNLVGAEGVGVGVLDATRATDAGAWGQDEEPIMAVVTTGFLHAGTEGRKWCKSVRLTFRRTTDSWAPVVAGHLEYRDSLGPWEPPIPVVIDGMDPVCVLNSLGTYRRRQWRFTFSDTQETLVLVAVEEEVIATD